jgi:hypothetical protein
MRVVVWALLAFGSVAVLVIPRFLPFYDYPEWVLQGRIVHDLWTGATNGGIATSQLYGLVAAPVPNLAAPVGIALLSFLLPIEAAGRAFLVIGVLGFGFGFGYLVRCLQRRPTVAEFTGFLWVFGYFLERGYVSYLFGLPIAFVAIGLVHRQATRPGRRVRLVVLVVLQVLAFLAHLVAWAVLVLATACYAVDLYRRGRRAEALFLLSTAAPAGILLVWYTVAAREVGHVALFANVREKLLSLAEAVLLFPRLDPYSGSVPSFPAQLLVVGAFLGIAAWGVHYRSAVAALRTPSGITAMILAAVALLDPVGNVNSLTKPDQRLLFPALLLVLAALPWKALRPSTAAVGLGLVAAGLVLHGVAFVSMDAPLQQAYAAIDDAIPDDAAVATVAIPADGGCRAGAGPSIGIPALKWFDVHRMLDRDEVRADLQETSGIALRFEPVGSPGLTTLSTAATAAGAALDGTQATYVEVFGCPADLARVRKTLAGRYTEIRSVEGLAVLRRSP